MRVSESLPQCTLAPARAGAYWSCVHVYWPFQISFGGVDAAGLGSHHDRRCAHRSAPKVDAIDASRLGCLIREGS